MIKGVLFDMDGVLLESEEYINKAGVLLFKEKGVEVNPEDFLQFTGMGENKYLGGVAEKYNIPFDVDRDKARAYEIYAELVHGKIKPLPGVMEFIEKCKSKGLKMAVATSADRVKMEINLREINLPETIFDATVNGLEIEKLKPEPDIFLLAAKRIGINPSSCLVVEDAISGVKAAKAAGSKVLALKTTFSEDDLYEAEWIASNLKNTPDAALNW